MMTLASNPLPRISALSVVGPSTLRISWVDGASPNIVDLGDWIASGGALLAPLKSEEFFAQAAVGGYGTMVTWDEGQGDLAIDAIHLRMIADASNGEK